MHRARIILLIVVALLGLGLTLWVLPNGAEEAAPPAGKAVDQAKVQAFLDKVFEARGGGRITVDPKRHPSPIPGVEEVRFVIEAAGMRQPGVVYLAGDKLILGQLIDLTTERNLTQENVGAPTKITYRLEDFDLKDSVPRGEASAALTLVEFSDFQCPYCKQTHETLQALMKKYPGKVRLYYKHFPLDNHPLAYPMALAAECARAQKPDAFWALHDDLFEKQYTGMDREVLTSRLRAWAPTAGLDAQRLATCVEKRETNDRVQADIREGRRLGVAGTPAIIANGEFMGGAVPFETFEQMIAPAKK